MHINTREDYKIYMGRKWNGEIISVKFIKCLSVFILYMKASNCYSWSCCEQKKCTSVI
jgi:hypothetical protein